MLMVIGFLEFWLLSPLLPASRWMAVSAVAATSIVVAALADDIGGRIGGSGVAWSVIRPFVSAGLLGAVFGGIQALALTGTSLSTRAGWVVAHALALASTGVALSSATVEIPALVLGVLLPGVILRLLVRYTRSVAAS